jgi:hypothetical protein
VATYFEARRYSAVLLHDSRVPDLVALRRALEIPTKACKPLADEATGLTRATFGSRKLHYPPAVRVLVQGEGNPHQIYLARSSPQAGSPLMIAAPYVNLLGEALAKINSAVPGDDALLYVRPNMIRLFEHFQRTTHRSVKATQIQVTMKRRGVDKVSLSGDNPLRSDLREALLRVARPAGIRLQSAHVKKLRATNVYIDQDGNLFWHLSDERTWGNVTPILELLTTTFDLETTTDIPLAKVLAKKKNSDSEDEEEVLEDSFDDVP